MLFLGQSDEYGRQHGKYVGLDKGYQQFEGIHEQVEHNRCESQCAVQGRSHAGGDENQSCQYEHGYVSCQHIGKQTDHQGKRLGEDAEELDERHHRYRHFQPPGNVGPEDVFPIRLGAEQVDCQKCADGQYHGDGNVSRNVGTTGEEGHQAHQVVDEDKEESCQQVGSKLFVFGAYTAFDDIVIDHHDEHFHQSDKAIRDIRRQVAVLSVDIAEKVLRKNLDEKQEQMGMIDRMLDEMLAAPKKN